MQCHAWKQNLESDNNDSQPRIVSAQTHNASLHGSWIFDAFQPKPDMFLKTRGNKQLKSKGMKNVKQLIKFLSLRFISLTERFSEDPLPI